MKKRLAVCIDDSPSFLFAPMFITKGKTYEVILNPASSTVQVLEPDDSLTEDPNGELVATKTKPTRYIRDRFRLID
jgi:hypothetical protein